MAKDLLVAMWPLDVLSAGFHTSNLNERLKKLKFVAGGAFAHLQSVAARMRITDPICVFVAPEYYFLKQIHEDGTWTMCSERDKDEICSELKALSKTHSKLVLLPGTIAWARQRRAPVPGHPDRVYDGFNTALFLRGGKILHEYDKKADDGNCRAKTANVSFASRRTSQIFKLRGLRCGIEVCADFGRKNLAKEAGAQSLDLEFYISATNPHNFSNHSLQATVPVKDGGYFIHCDASGAESPKNNVWHVKRGGGLHGIPDFTSGYDPWTCRPVLADGAGSRLALGSIIAPRQGNSVQVSLPVLPTRRGSFSHPATPGPVVGRAPVARARGSSFSMGGPSQTLPASSTATLFVRLEPVPPGMQQNGDYTAQVEARLSPGSNLGNHIIRFRTDHGTIAPVNVATDPNGVATATLRTNRSTKTTVTATFAGKSANGSIEHLTLGAGNVSRMAKLFPAHDPEVPSWHAPIAT